MSDIIVRLRDPLDCPDTKSVFALCREAADLLEANAAEIKRLRRERDQWCETASNQDGLLNQYAAENEKLQAEIANLRQSCTDLEARSARLFAENEKLRALHTTVSRDNELIDQMEALAAVEQSEAGVSAVTPSTTQMPATTSCVLVTCVVIAGLMALLSIPNPKAP